MTAFACSNWRSRQHSVEGNCRYALVHAYFDIDTDMVWETLRVEIPSVLVNLQALLSHPD